MRRLGQDNPTGPGCLTHLRGLAGGDRLLTELRIGCLGGRGLKRKGPRITSLTSACSFPTSWLP